MTSTTTTTTVTEHYDKVITYEPPPVKLTTVYAPHAVRTFYNSYRVPRLHTVYKSVSPPRIHTVISTPRLHTIVTEPARVETSIIKVAPPAKKVTTTTTSTVNIPVVTKQTTTTTCAAAPATTTTTVWPPVKNCFNYYHHPRFPRCYNDLITTETVQLPVRSRSVHSLVKDDKYEYEYTETTNAENKTTFEYKVKSAAEPAPEPEAAPAPAAEPAPAEPEPTPAPAAEPAPAPECCKHEETIHYLRPSKSFNGLNTLTYNSFVYDLNHGFDSNHKHVTVLKEAVTDSDVTVSAAVPLPYALRSKNFFLGDIRNTIVNNDGVAWYGHPTLFPFRHWY